MKLLHNDPIYKEVQNLIQDMSNLQSIYNNFLEICEGCSLLINFRLNQKLKEVFIMRMTWNEIVKQYPNQWVGLSKIEWSQGGQWDCGGHGPDVISAEVKYIGKSKSELIEMQINGEDIYVIHTAPNSLSKAIISGFQTL